MSRIRHKIKRIVEQPSIFKEIRRGIVPRFSKYCLTAEKLLRAKPKMVVDIGANEGRITKACIFNFPQAKIYAFEPIAEHYEKLSQLKNTTAFKFGLWDGNLKKKFYFVKSKDVESSFLKPTEVGEGDVEERTVELRRFDTFNISIERPCFVKIDVEGAEYNVLKGFGNKLNEVDVLQIEMTHIDKNVGKNRLSSIMRLLEDNGFTGFIQVNTTYYPDGTPMKSDLLFHKGVRKNE